MAAKFNSRVTNKKDMIIFLLLYKFNRKNLKSFLFQHFLVFPTEIFDSKFPSSLVAIIIIIIIVRKILVLNKFGVIIFLIHYSDL